MNYPLELIIEWKIVTGWDEPKVLEELKKLDCNFWEALKFLRTAGRMPDTLDQEVLRNFGFPVWQAMQNSTDKFPAGR